MEVIIASGDCAVFPERESGQHSRTGMRVDPRGHGGNASELGDVGGSLGKSSLFFLTGLSPGIRLARDRVSCPVKHHPCGPVSSAGPAERTAAHGLASVR